MYLGATLNVRGYRLQAKSVFARWNHGKRNRSAIATCVHMFGFKPRAEARIVDFRLALPEVGGQTTLDPKMIQLQFDHGDILREIAPDIVIPDVNPGNALTFALRFDYHRHLLFILDEILSLGRYLAEAVCK